MANPFKSFAKDVVMLKKQSGEEYPDIKAHVQKDLIFIHDSSLPIEEGDRITRTLSNGLQESYIVLDRGYYEKIHGIDAHYQCEVRKETSLQYKEWASNITNHFHGANSRVNIGSTDNSTNINNTQKDNLFEELRVAIMENFSSEHESKILMELVDSMEETSGTPSYKEKYKNFMESIATHLTVFSPFLPALAQLL